MMQLALEIPTIRLEQWCRHADLDFILAHKVLADEVYAEFFATREEGRELILDNSTHEFGAPLPLIDLQRAVDRVKADIVIAPDIIWPDMSKDQYKQNIQWMRDTCAAIKGCKVAAVLCGQSKDDRAAFLAEAVKNGVEVLCFTFHDMRRLEWWREFKESEHFMVASWKRFHVLGVDTLEEMRAWVDIAQAHPDLPFSIDTTKAVKWGAQGKRFNQLTSLRGGDVSAKDVLELTTFDFDQDNAVIFNIDTLKRICRGLTPWI